MISNWLRSLPRALHLILAPALAVLVASALVACGGGGFLPSPLSVTDPRPLSAEFLTRKTVNYSPYRDAECEDKRITPGCTKDIGDEVFTRERILQDLQLIRAAGIGTIRLFSSGRFGELVLGTIRSEALDLKVMLGAYPNPVVDAAAEADNQAELDEAIRLANKYSDIVLAVSVGNETMVYWSTHKIDPKVMGGYILKVRQAIKQPVTTDDNWAFWASAPTAITDVVDFAAVHTYPLLDTFYSRALWDWRQRDVPEGQRAEAMMDAAVTEAKRQFGEARAFMDRIGLPKLPMVIGETGWTAVDYDGDPALPFRVHAVNQKMYYDRLQDWVAEGRAGNGPLSIFVFQAFDERWKGGDDGWGLFTRGREARCVVQTLNAPSSAWVYDTTQSCAADAAVYFVEAVVTDPQPANVTRFTFLTDAGAAPVAGEVLAPAQLWASFGGRPGGTAGYLTVAGGAPGDSVQSVEIQPTPANYGWGLLRYPDTSISGAASSANLSGFTSLTFWIKTNGYGKLEIGLFSDTDDRSGAEVFLQIAPGQYGYVDDNTWRQVTIPIADFLAKNPLLDVRLMTSGFVISDRFEFTGKPLGTTGLPKIGVDGIAWTR